MNAANAVNAHCAGDLIRSQDPSSAAFAFVTYTSSDWSQNDVVNLSVVRPHVTAAHPLFRCVYTVCKDLSSCIVCRA